MAVTYLDYNASSPLPRELISEVPALLEASIASPSSLHGPGRKGRRVINDATEIVARFIGCDPTEIFWNSGASESNSWVLNSVARLARSKGRPPRLVVSAIEHESTLLAARALERDAGATIEYLQVTPAGVVDLDHFESLLAEGDWDLISVLYANNETGVIQPIERIGSRCRKKEVLFHSDSVQVLGKVPVAAVKTQARYLTFSGHKIGAPKGVGFTIMRGEGQALWPIVYGKQQKSLRGGTENTFGVGLLGKICELLERDEYKSKKERVLVLHKEFEAELKRRVSGVVIHGEAAVRLGNTTYVGFEGIDGDGILMNLDLAGISASSGSACTSGSLDPSHVLLAMGCDKRLARSSVRFSSGLETTADDFEKVLDVLPGIVDRVRKAGLRS